MIAYDGLGAEQIIDAWLAAHGDHDIDDEGTTLSDLLETVPEIRADLEVRIARALGACAQLVPVKLSSGD